MSSDPFIELVDRHFSCVTYHRGGGPEGVSPSGMGKILDFAFAKGLFPALKSSNFGLKNVFSRHVCTIYINTILLSFHAVQLSFCAYQRSSGEGCRLKRVNIFYCLVRNFSVHPTLFEQKILAEVRSGSTPFQTGCVCGREGVV